MRFLYIVLFLLEQSRGILDKVLAILAISKRISKQSGLFLEQWKDILEHRCFIRTNKNILEQFHLY